MIEELHDADRQYTLLPNVRPRGLWRVRWWLVKWLVGDSPVALNLTISGGIANRFTPNGAIISHNIFVPAPEDGPEYLVHLSDKFDQRVVW